MFLHIGSDINVKKEDIIGIFELDGKITPEITKEFLKEAQKNNSIESAGTDLPKSFVVIKDVKSKSGMKIYLSHISVASLIKRCELPF